MEIENIINSIDANRFKAFDSKGEKIVYKNKYIYRLMYLDSNIKLFYQDIKNAFLSYGAKTHMTSRMEIVSYKGRVAKFIIRGKSLSLFLNLDKSYLENKRYHLKDMSSNPKHALTPLKMRIKSNRSRKLALELIDIIFACKGKKKKRGFKPLYMIPDMIPSGEAILAKLGFKDEYLKKTIDVKNISKDIPREVNEFLPKIVGEELDEEVIANVYLDTLCVHFEENELITLDILKEKGIVIRGNYLKIKARGNLSKRFTIIADSFDPQAIAMLLCTNSKIVLIER